VAQRTTPVDDPDARFESAEAPSEPVLEAPVKNLRSKPGQPHHDPIDPDLLDDLHTAIGRGLALVRLDESAAPREVVRAVARYLDDVRAGRDRLTSDPAEAVLALACLYGQAIARELGWGFAHVRCVRKPGILVISPGRHYAAAPRAVIDRALERGGRELETYFERLSGGVALPESSPGRYRRVDP